jgi:hypothetical protein
MRVPLHEKITTKRERKDALSRTIMEHVSYFSGVWRKLRRSLVFLTLESLVGDSLANHNSDLIVDRGEPLFGSFRDYNFMSKDAILFANQLIGYGNNFAGMIIHPFVLMTLRGLPEFRTKFFPDRRRYVHFYMGIPIVITEYMTVESKPIPESSLDKVYSSYLLGEGAFAYGEIVPEDSFGVSEYSSTMAVIASKVKFALQPWGYDCAVDPRKTVGWEDNPKSYSRVMDRGKIPLVVVKTRG